MDAVLGVGRAKMPLISRIVMKGFPLNEKEHKMIEKFSELMEI